MSGYVSTVFLFSDETGNFDFSRNRGASRYFGVGTLLLRDDGPDRLCAELTRLRRRLAWAHHGLDSCFHATQDSLPVREAVFALLERHDLRFDVTMLEKSKAQPQLRETEHRFFQHAWYYHLRTLVRRELNEGDSLFVVASELGTKRTRAAFRNAVNDVLAQCVSYRIPRVLAFWPNASDPCLQAADYLLWAVSRAYELGDTTYRDQVAHQVRSDYDLFARGTTHYY